MDHAQQIDSVIILAQNKLRSAVYVTTGVWLIVVNDGVFVCACVEVVSANSEKIRAEELECKAMAENAQRDLDEALPALEEAMKVDFCPV